MNLIPVALPAAAVLVIGVDREQKRRHSKTLHPLARASLRIVRSLLICAVVDQSGGGDTIALISEGRFSEVKLPKLFLPMAFVTVYFTALCYTLFVPF